MDRKEAVLRELNLYPLWKRRGEAVPDAAGGDGNAGEAGTGQPAMEAVARPVLRAVAPPSSSRIAYPEAEPVAEPDAASGSAASVASSPGETGRAQCIAGLDWPQLKEMVRDCTACKLRAGCTQTVFGVGSERADWLFVGEGPGADEDAKGEPFVGQAGRLLDNMLMSVRLKRGNNVYIANVVKCRPPANRAPEPDETAACFPYLQRQIQLIQPKVIVALGKTAATALLGRDAPLGSLRGAAHDYRGIPLIVTYHPAYLLRSPLEKAKAWEDLCRAAQVFDARS